ncbi:hypothetical protein GJ631_00850 [Natronomonas sp. CBA1123]|uniref:pentapeptide repeat-containing protein n=1 Tax=Natronomonas sp. CBA1123 TaxID=2668070 RepID=UPI0012EA8DED|nr:hypothetical protein [Natronomonas sp. CBA1123]
MSDVSTDRCGYTWPCDHEIDDDPNKQNCCWREALPETDRCAWHADPHETEAVTTASLQSGRIPPEDTENPPSYELLDGITVSANVIDDTISFERVIIRDGDLSGVDLQAANFSDSVIINTDFRGSDLTDSVLDDALFQDCNLSETNLTGASLWDTRFSNTDLSNSDLTTARLGNTRFQETTLTGSNLSHLDLANSYFEEVDLTAATLHNCDLSKLNSIHATLADADLTDANLSSVRLPNADLSGANLAGADLTNIWLPDGNLSDVSLRGAILSDSTLDRATFSNADVAGADFTDASLDDADFTDADLSDATLRRCSLTAANLTSASLLHTDLKNANLHDGTLAEATLSTADLTNTDLSAADLTGADLSDATICEANLENAFLSRAMLFDADLRGAKLHGSVIGDAQINEDTAIIGAPNTEGMQSPHTVTAIHSKRGCVYDPAYPNGEAETDTDKAKSVYRALEELGRRRARPRLQARCFVRRQDLQKRDYWEDATANATSVEERIIAGSRWSRAKVARATLLYGESPWRVIAWSLSIILSFALLYPLGGWIKPTGGDPLTYATISSNPVEILNSVYYSTLTYTALGFGDFQPVGFGRLLTTLETGFGAVMLALLVFILGRRAAR